MAIEVVFDQARRSSDRVAGLRHLASLFLDEGAEPAALLRQFEPVRQELRGAGRDDDDDAVMDTMDFLTGWCSPHMRLPNLTPASPPSATPNKP